MRIISVIIVVILLIGFTNCRKGDAPIYELSTFSIFREQSSVWADFYYKATIDQNGTLIVEEKHGLSNQYRKSEFHISSEDLISLKEKLKEIVSIEISDKYGFHDNAATDAPITRLKYVTKIKSDSTCIYYPDKNELPDKLDIFLQVVDQILSKNDTFKK